MRLDYAAINKKLLKTPAIESIAAQNMKQRFELAHTKMMQDFDGHVVTREIEGGPNATNISGTLGGRGNLFSFIGFPLDSKPVEIVRNLLRSRFRLVPRDKRIEGNKWVFNYRVLIPEEELRIHTPLPFEIGNSWLYGIEEGISGFSQYVFTQLTVKNSRSGRGIQNESVNLAGTFTPIPYITEIINNFRYLLRVK